MSSKIFSDEEQKGVREMIALAVEMSDEVKCYEEDVPHCTAEVRNADSKYIFLNVVSLYAGKRLF